MVSPRGFTKRGPPRWVPHGVSISVGPPSVVHEGIPLKVVSKECLHLGGQKGPPEGVSQEGAAWGVSEQGTPNGVSKGWCSKGDPTWVFPQRGGATSGAPRGTSVVVPQGGNPRGPPRGVIQVWSTKGGPTRGFPNGANKGFPTGDSKKGGAKTDFIKWSPQMVAPQWWSPKVVPQTDSLRSHNGGFQSVVLHWVSTKGIPSKAVPPRGVQLWSSPTGFLQGGQTRGFP
jgi:hypothetical protein